MLKFNAIELLASLTLSQADTGTINILSCEHSMAYRYTIQECEKIEVVSIEYFEVSAHSHD